MRLRDGRVVWIDEALTRLRGITDDVAEHGAIAHDGNAAGAGRGIESKD